MKKFDTFEWALICLLIGLFITGVFVALDRHDENVAVNTTQQSPDNLKL